MNIRMIAEVERRLKKVEKEAGEKLNVTLMVPGDYTQCRITGFFIESGYIEIKDACGAPTLVTIDAIVAVTLPEGA